MRHRAYLDNVIASGRVIGDLSPSSEMEAYNKIEAAHIAGTLKRVTSRESWREQGRTKDPGKRAQLEAVRSEVSVVPTDHVVQGFSTFSDPFGTLITFPHVSDIVDPPLFSELRRLGLKDLTPST